MSRLIVRIEETTFEAELCENRAPSTCDALRKLTPLDLRGYQSMWSGGTLLANLPKIGKLPIENRVTYLGTGSIVFHPGLKELGIAYGDTQFKEPTGAVYVTKVGEIAKNLGELAEIGNRAQHEGSRDIRIWIEE